MHVEVDELGDDLKILKLMLSLFPMQGQMKLLGELIKAWKSELLLVSSLLLLKRWHTWTCR